MKLDKQKFIKVKNSLKINKLPSGPVLAPFFLRSSLRSEGLGPPERSEERKNGARTGLTVLHHFFLPNCKQDAGDYDVIKPLRVARAAKETRRLLWRL